MQSFTFKMLYNDIDNLANVPSTNTRLKLYVFIIRFRLKTALWKAYLIEKPAHNFKFNLKHLNS